MYRDWDAGTNEEFDVSYGPEPVDWPEPVLEPSDDDLMTQYDNEVLDEDYEEVDEPDPDLAYDQWREARIWGT